MQGSYLDAETDVGQGGRRDDAVRAVNVLPFEQAAQRALASGADQNEKFAVCGHEKSLAVGNAGEGPPCGTPAWGSARQAPAE